MSEDECLPSRVLFRITFEIQAGEGLRDGPLLEPWEELGVTPGSRSDFLTFRMPIPQ